MSALSLPLAVASAAGATEAAAHDAVVHDAVAADTAGAPAASDPATVVPARIETGVGIPAKAAPGPLAGAQDASAAPAIPALPVREVQATTAQLAVPAAPVAAPAASGSLGGAVFALVLVVGLILALSWLARRIPALGGGGAGAHPALRVVGSLALGPRDRLVVVAVGETQLLLGVGAGGTRTLHTLDQPLPAPGDRPTPAFAQLLAQHFGKKP